MIFLFAKPKIKVVMRRKGFHASGMGVNRYPLLRHKRIRALKSSGLDAQRYNTGTGANGLK